MLKSKLSFVLHLFMLFVFYSNCVSTNEANAQRVSYSDLFKELENLTNEQAYSRLYNYQKQNPYFVNTYMQLGSMSEIILSETDPLREYELAKYWASNAILYYDLIKVFIQDNEARSNEELYSNIPIESSGRSLTNEEIINYADQRIEYCNSFKDSIELIFQMIETSKDHYNNCIRIFNVINDNYDNINDALLKTNADFLKKLDELQHEFNATINYFERYKTLLDKFPVGSYNQTFKLRPVKTFRLDGITNSDFLQSSFYIWDYGSWVDEYKNLYENDILTLRDELEDIQGLFNKNKQHLSEVMFLDTVFGFETYDDLFLFRLGKYDNSSLIREQFNYLDKRQDFIIKTKDILNNPADSSSAIESRKLRYYYRLAYNLNNSKAALYELQNTITEERIDRFSEFFNKHYNGLEGFRSFVGFQFEFLDVTFNEELSKLKSYFKNNNTLKNSYRPVYDQAGDSIPLTPVTETEELYNSFNYITTVVFYNHDHPLYTAGYLKAHETKTPFIAKISESFEIEWIKKINPDILNIAQTDVFHKSSVEKIYAYENGVIALITSYANIADNYDTLRYMRNNLIHLDNDSEVIFNNNIQVNKTPLFIQYDEINQLSHLTFGNKKQGKQDVYTEISILQADSTGAIVWEAPIDIEGQFVDMVRAENKFIAYLNFKQYNILDEKVVTGNMGKDWAFLAVDVSLNGKVMNANPMISNKSIYINRIFRISSDEINLLGYEGKPNDIPGNLKYFIISDEGNLILHN